MKIAKYDEALEAAQAPTQKLFAQRFAPLEIRSIGVDC
jgi:hypothetical protein